MMRCSGAVCKQKNVPRDLAETVPSAASRFVLAFGRVFCMEVQMRPLLPILLASCAAASAPDSAPTQISQPAEAPKGPKCLRPVPFLEDHSGPSKAALPILDLDARCLKGSQASATLTGYPDDTVSADQAEGVGLKMAEAVKAELVRLGVPAERLLTRGPSTPAQRCPDPPQGCREQYRRVEVTVP